MVDKKKIEKAVAELLVAIGEDPNREGLKDTPERVARMYEELTAGYHDNASEHLSRTFDESRGELVLEKDIAFSSMCEHHLMPFFGKVHIAYIPNGKVVGLSKLARVVEVYCRRLQLQERMNAEIADAIWQELSPKGVFVIVEAEHTCMTARGIKKVGSKTVTMAVRGDFSEELKNQVLALIK
ncbi:MAG: GTP cyclohydrolase I FolE [Clostridia bacterium]|nr:GTP cyclohydrolase I FolE [Clostridia bacterium]